MAQPLAFRRENVIYLSFTDTTIGLLAGASEVKNIITKPFGFYDQFCQLTGQATTIFGKSIAPLVVVMNSAKSVLDAREGVSKLGWYKEVVPFAKRVWTQAPQRGQTLVEEGRKFTHKVADWVMGAWATTNFLNTTKIVELSKTVLYRGHWCSTAASFTYSALGLYDVGEKFWHSRTLQPVRITQIVNNEAQVETQQVGIVRRPTGDRPIQFEDKVGMFFSTVVSICFIAHCILSIPVLLNWTIAASATAALYIKAAQLACLVGATAGIVGTMYLNKMMLEPLDKSFIRQ